MAAAAGVAEGSGDAGLSVLAEERPLHSYIIASPNRSGCCSAHSFNAAWWSLVSSVVPSLGWLRVFPCFRRRRHRGVCHAAGLVSHPHIRQKSRVSHGEEPFDCGFCGQGEFTVFGVLVRTLSPILLAYSVPGGAGGSLVGTAAAVLAFPVAGGVWNVDAAEAVAEGA
ncbi:hypothetical protein [Streptomyces sp. NPDC059122]|uniref:hypothetical protein n=1 Tax=Streptomyces sp. NPDC059122 TaxID=3346732 RepID=UPI0036B2A68B